MPIHHFRRSGLQLSTGKALKGEICLSENLLTVIRTNLRVMGTGFPQLHSQNGLDIIEVISLFGRYCM